MRWNSSCGSCVKADNDDTQMMYVLSLILTPHRHSEPSFIEAQWTAFFKDSQTPALHLALVLFTWHQVVFFGRYLLFYICDFIPSLAKYKIQPVRLCNVNKRRTRPFRKING